MIDSKIILDKMTNLGISTNIEEIEKLISENNIEDLTVELKRKYKLEIWDKKSNINGIEAKTIIDSRSYEIGYAYIIYIDNKLIYFQDHNPNESGFIKMTKAQATKLGNEFIDKRIEENIDNIIYNNVKNKLLCKK